LLLLAAFQTTNVLASSLALKSAVNQAEAANKYLKIEIQQRQRAEAALIDAKKLADSANKAKSEFLANMSHEIRTPLNGVIGMTDLALDTELSAEQREYLDTVKLSADSLLGVINDILDFSKIEAGKIELEHMDFNIRNFLAGTLKTLSLRADEKNIALLCEVAPEVPEFVRGDPGRLRQVLVNLVGNAIKFTSVGEVALSVKPRSPNRNERMLHFIVSDTGIGIAPTKQKQVFEPFVQADNSTTRKYGGSGLGLTISKRLVEKMGGQLWVESEVDVGSKFHFTVALDAARKIGASASESANGDKGEIHQITPTITRFSSRAPEVRLRVLVAEDNLVNQLLAVRLLEKRGHKVHVVSNGQEALNALQKPAYDLVLMDVQMPVMDGLEAVKAIRESEKSTGGRLAVVALTAHALKEDRERCLSAGMDGYISKPIRPQELDEILNVQIALRAKTRKVLV
jgi:signal transduction histidine kinase/CheY-like chemotaxis protein